MSGRGRGRGKRISRENKPFVPPEPFRSQSMTISVENHWTDQRRFSSRNRTTRQLAIPENEVFSMAKRPDQGGTAGRSINLFTNHFRCHLPEKLQCFQYDIELEVENRDGGWRPAKRDDRFPVLTRIIERENFPLVWFDEGKTLYSIETLDRFEKQYEILLKDTKTTREQHFRFQILNLVKTYDIQSLWDFIENRLVIRPRDPIRVLETLLKQRTRTSMVCVKNQFYDRQQTLDDLGDGRGLAHGAYQAIFVTKIGPTLNVNSTFTCFYQPMNLVDFLCAHLERDITQTGLNEREQKMLISKVLKPIWVETRHTDFIRKYRIRSFSLSARQMTFSKVVEDNRAEYQSVFDYFSEKYQIRLQFPDLPTLELYTPPNTSTFNYLPLECCFIQSWQRSAKPLTTDQRIRVTKRTVVDPERRYQSIMGTVRSRDFNADRFVQGIKMSIDDQEMINIPARIIFPPEIKYRSGRDGHSDVVERINIGKWNLRNLFMTERTINQWACVLISSQRPSPQQMSIAGQFVDEFGSKINQYGIYFVNQPMMYTERAESQQIESRMEYLKGMNCEVVVFILHCVSEEVYKLIKTIGNRKLGLVTQCTDFTAISRNIQSQKLDMYLQNLYQKFNAKIGGVNGLVSLARALTQSSSRDDVFMFFGADVTHTSCTKEKPSIAAVIGSIDATSTQYASRLSEQYATRGRVSLEIIKDLYQMATDLLKLFAQRNGFLPNKIVFYRDGVDDGHFQKVLDNEVRALKNACKALYLDNELPKITFIVVKKRHNTRFFLLDPNGRSTNVQPGTVIDTHLVHPHDFDFYLNSHAAIQGTSRPILYHVLYDEIGFSSDEIQSLTYFLCHADVRCTKAVSIPAPVHYAHLAAYQSRDAESHEFERKSHQGGDDDETNDVDEDEEELRDQFGSIDLQEVQTRLIQLDPTIQDTMWYV